MTQGRRLKKTQSPLEPVIDDLCRTLVHVANEADDPTTRLLAGLLLRHLYATDPIVDQIVELPPPDEEQYPTEELNVVETVRKIYERGERPGIRDQLEYCYQHLDQLNDVTANFIGSVRLLFWRTLSPKQRAWVSHTYDYLRWRHSRFKARS
jgi:hypothetical protein